MLIIYTFTLLLTFIVIIKGSDHGFGKIFGSGVFSDDDISGADISGEFPDSEIPKEINDPVTDDLSSQEVRAVAVIKGYGQALGVIHLVQIGDGPTQIQGSVAGLRPAGSHGFHFHKKAITGGDCQSAGGHYNPTSQPHGGRNDAVRHIGDLGNIHADATGVAKFNFIDHQVSLIGPHSVIGRSLIVHVNKDDLGQGYNKESKRSGNSGSRLACGTISFVHIKKGSVSDSY